MKFHLIAKIFGKILLLALIPILLAFRFNWDAILPIIIYLQLLLIWAQAEIGLRQHILFSAQFDPSFYVELHEPSVVTRREKSIIIIQNTSKNPAYNIMVGRVLNEQYKPIPPDNWKDKVSSELIGGLAPDQAVILCSLNDKDFVENKMIEVLYTNQFGDWKEIYIRFLKDGKLSVSPKEVQKPGFLLNTFEDLTLILRFIKYERRSKLIEKKSHKKA